MSTRPPEPPAASRSSARRAEELAALERLLGLCEVQAVRSGVPFPLGARPRGEGVNFAVFSRHATGVRLDLFANAEDGTPTRTIVLDAARNKTGDIWHVWLAGIPPGQLYYELHVRGYTIDRSAGTEFPGTYRGLIEKIPHSKSWYGERVPHSWTSEYRACRWMDSRSADADTRRLSRTWLNRCIASLQLPGYSRRPSVLGRRRGLGSHRRRACGPRLPVLGLPDALVDLGEGRGERYVCCAVDALGMGPMLGQHVRIRSRCHHSGTPMDLSVDPSGPGSDAEDVMVWVGKRPEDERRACDSL